MDRRFARGRPLPRRPFRVRRRSRSAPGRDSFGQVPQSAVRHTGRSPPAVGHPGTGRKRRRNHRGQRSRSIRSTIRPGKTSDGRFGGRGSGPDSGQRQHCPGHAAVAGIFHRAGRAMETGEAWRDAPPTHGLTSRRTNNRCSASSARLAAKIPLPRKFSRPAPPAACSGRAGYGHLPASGRAGPRSRGNGARARTQPDEVAHRGRCGRGCRPGRGAGYPQDRLRRSRQRAQAQSPGQTPAPSSGPPLPVLRPRPLPSIPHVPTSRTHQTDASKSVQACQDRGPGRSHDRTTGSARKASAGSCDLTEAEIPRSLSRAESLMYAGKLAEVAGRLPACSRLPVRPRQRPSKACSASSSAWPPRALRAHSRALTRSASRTPSPGSYACG